MRLVWPAFNIDPGDDTSPEPGLQIDFDLRTSLLPGSRGVLTVQGEEGDPVRHPEPAIADDEGTLRFTGVTVPLGRVTLDLTVENECGQSESVREPFVWDGLGMPACDMDLGVEPAVVDELAPLRVLRAEHDDDPGTPGIELPVLVDAGRPDVTVTLFVLDAATGEEEAIEQETGDDLTAEFAVALGEGEHALRAICPWEPAGLRPSTPTFRFLVDTQPPDCALVAPTSRIAAADDLDPDADGVQFEMRGRSDADDVAGQPALFTSQGEEVEGSALDEDGLSSTTATIVLDPPGGAQELSFRTRDRAGNPCEAAVTF
ncbi:MAG TPA: hypothetical protein VKB80_06735 [Kofleriaceae bacterium]|nr:hypothetical protein [Kofleriaceae bacterium]